MASAQRAVVIRVELFGIEPLVWRRVRVMPSTTLAALHRVLQVVMGWQDTHLHQFRIGRLRIGEPDRQEDAKDLEDEREWTVADVVKAGASEFEYLYDFGDDWTHRLVIETNAPKVVGSGALCLAGENACPPEDVGGPPGYEEFLAAMANSKHRRHREFAEWCGGVWDPKAFDLNAVNRVLRSGR
ncbi:MAG: plasmid pRiA4b ORF-3 family protein [Dehalococcoidia bacterium]